MTFPSAPANRKPLAIDLYCGLGGWAEGLLSERWEVVGFDIERHDYGTGGYPGQLVLQDVLTLDGRRFKDAGLIVASPPCQAYSYRAMPWKRAKALPPPDNTLFEACFRIQREAIEAAGHHIPMVVENVRGAEKWVGRARWHYGSFYLWGDVPPLMPPTKHRKLPGNDTFYKGGGPCGKLTDPRYPSKVPVHGFKDIPHSPTGHWTNPGENGCKNPPDGLHEEWFRRGLARHSSKSNARKAATAMISKIPFPLAQWIARCYREARFD